MKKHKILIVDDDQLNLDLLEACLATAEDKYIILKAEDGAEALTIIEKEKPDLVLLDIMMPIMNGYEVCKTIKNNPDTYFLPVIMITALHDKENKIKGIQVGADDFLTKPVDRIELLTRVKSLLYTKTLHDNLENHYKLLKQELAMAKFLQQSLLPDAPPKINSLDIAVFYEPSIEIGGDYYYFMDIADDKLGIFLADISGHGVSAAMKAMVLKDRLFQARNLWDKPQELINHLNIGLLDFFSLTDSDSFVTAIYLIINTKDWNINMVNAGHPEPLLQYNDTSKILNEATTLPLGVFANMTFDISNVNFPDKGKLCLFTDGFYETKTKGNHQMSINELYNKLDEFKHLNSTETINEINNFIETKAIETQHDDRNLIIIKRK